MTKFDQNWISNIQTENAQDALDQKTDQKVDMVIDMLERYIRWQKKPEKFKNKFLKFLKKAVIVYALVATQFGILLFVGEESLQTAGFSCFGYIEAEDWHGVENVCKATYDSLLDWYGFVSTLKDPILEVQWAIVLNPLMTPGYQRFYQASLAYSQQLDARLMHKK